MTTTSERQIIQENKNVKIHDFSCAPLHYQKIITNVKHLNLLGLNNNRLLFLRVEAVGLAVEAHLGGIPAVGFQVLTELVAELSDSGVSKRE